jgi:hypothetical protein
MAQAFATQAFATQAFATFLVQQEPYVVRIIINQEQGDDKDFRDIIAAFMKIFESQRPVSVIIDASALKTLNKQNVKDIRHFIKHNRPVFEAYLKCSSLVVRSVIVKNIINLIFKVQPPVRPNLIVNTLEEANQFVAGY